MPVLAMAYVLTGEKQYLAAARRWALASCGYKTWGLGRIDGMDLATGHQLFGLALVYDWCYHDLDEEARRRFRETLVSGPPRCSRRRPRARPGGISRTCRTISGSTSRGWPSPGWRFSTRWTMPPAGSGCPWRSSAGPWRRWGRTGPATRAWAIGSTASSTCSSSWTLPSTNLDTDLYGSPWWRNTAQYAQYLTLPRRAWKSDDCIVDLADCPRGHWYGPDYLSYAAWPGNFKTAMPNGWPSRSTRRTSPPRRPPG